MKFILFFFLFLVTSSTESFSQTDTTDNLESINDSLNIRREKLDKKTEFLQLIESQEDSISPLIFRVLNMYSSEEDDLLDELIDLHSKEIFRDTSGPTHIRYVAYTPTIDLEIFPITARGDTLHLVQFKLHIVYSPDIAVYSKYNTMPCYIKRIRRNKVYKVIGYWGKNKVIYEGEHKFYGLSPQQISLKVNYDY